MSQYGAPSKNPPWVRNSGVPNQQSIQSQMMGPLNTQGLVYQQPPQMFQSPLGMQQSANMISPINSGVAMNPLGASQQQLYGASATVSYPVPRSLNSTAFSAASVNPSAPPVGQTTSPSATPKQRVFTGTVTKVHDNFGFVDEDIFFQMSCCMKGSNPVVGDRVLVEASFSPNMPFKWNATRLQVLPMGNASIPGNLASNLASNMSNNLNSNIPAGLANALNLPSNNLNNLNNIANNLANNPSNNLGNNSGRKGFCSSPNSYNAVPPTMDISSSNNSGSNYSRSRVSPRRERPRQNVRERERKEEDERRRRREERSKESSKEERSSHSTRSPSSQRRRSKSPRSKRRPRPTPRYMVHVPKIALDVPEADVLELRRRYNSLYIPSDFFASNFRWVDAFPPNTPFTLDRSCLFHIMHRDTDQVTENKAVLDPPDADYLFSAKVMLMSMPDMDDFVKKCCQMTEEAESSDNEGRDFVHPTRLVNFLVGLRGKNETMAIGGPWSKSLDGPDPDKDPQVLIRTAIRNCQALTGIDLSTCTQWYRFVEIYYRRGETTHKGKVVAARVETVVLFLPDVWSCVPTRLEWDALHLTYKRHLDRKLKALLQMESDDETGIADEKEGEEMVDIAKKEPTHWSKLDPKVMQVSELRQELEARNMASKGLKSQLLARLQKVLKQEQDLEVKEKEEAGDGDGEDDAQTAGTGSASNTAAATKDPDPEPSDRDNDKDKKEDEEKKKQVEKDKATMEKRYELPEKPHIIVHPNRLAKSGKFDCTTMSLSLLLDYRQDDTKEHSFEVSLFAELFNEMLMRDCGFRIYRALYEHAERLKDEEKDKEKKKKDDKDRKEKDDRDDKKKTDDDKDEKEKEEGKEKEKNGEKATEGSDKDRRKEDREKDDKKDKKKKEKVVTTDPLLLLAFVYFDQTHCGYILDKDLEELLYALGLNLSRAQVKRIVQSVLTKDTRESRENREALYYRRLTDRPQVTANQQRKEEENGAKPPESGENLECIAFGNKRLLPVFSSGNGGPPPTKRARRDSQDQSQTPEGYVMYKGGLLDVEKLMSQLKRSEKARSDTESTLTHLREELVDVKKSASNSANKVSDLSTELNEYKEKLRKTLEDLSSVQSRSSTYWSTLKDVHSRITEVITKKEEVVTKTEPKDSTNADEKTSS